MRSEFIDPGFAGRGSAIAMYRHATLYGVTFVRSDCPFVGYDDPHVVIVERPEYQGARSNDARIADLMKLSWEGALIAGLRAGRTGAEVIAVTPGEWKRNESKPSMHLRVWEALLEEERDIVARAFDRWVDAERIGAAIRDACTKGALDRWRRPGGTYYPARLKSLTDLLDAVSMGAIYHRRADGFGTHASFGGRKK